MRYLLQCGNMHLSPPTLLNWIYPQTARSAGFFLPFPEGLYSGKGLMQRIHQRFVHGRTSAIAAAAQPLLVLARDRLPVPAMLNAAAH
jgi:hypothetical protein